MLIKKKFCKPMAAGKEEFLAIKHTTCTEDSNADTLFHIVRKLISLGGCR